jgi:hypothetical protein
MDAPVLVNDVKLSDSLTLDGIFGMNFLFGSVLTQNTDFGGVVLPVPVALAPGAFDWVTIDEPNGLLKVRARIPGDANHDGKVDFADLVAVAQNYGNAPDPSDSWAGGDFNGDNVVDFADMVALAQHYELSDLLDGDQIDLPNVPFDLGFAQAPEPSSVVLLMGGIVLVLGRRRRR